jgi:8-oxo-dGTP pyrophosphatase MutT (NUDIX family)
MFLLVSSRSEPSFWVYPKGHIERGETAERAAVREVLEEAGVVAEIVHRLDDVRINRWGEDLIVRYYLMRAAAKGTPGEGRRSCWVSPAEAMRRLPFANQRMSLRQALRVLKNNEQQ